jgi:hypothetical protein
MPFRSAVRLACAAAVAVLLAAGLDLFLRQRLWALPASDAAGAADRPVYSLLALGDGGRGNSPLWWFDRPLAVGAGLAREHRSRPADGLVLLGDNFYYEGLRAVELEARLRRNLVAPYCAFVDLAGLLSVRVEAACRLAPEARRPVPIFVVLGNHDHLSPESPPLQREIVPLYVPNWRLAGGLVAAAQPDPEVSLVFLDAELAMHRAEIPELARALAASPGPWRVLVTHHPIAFEPHLEYSRAVSRALADAGVPVQVVLAGHEHNLQLFAGPGPVVHVIAGAGSKVQPIEERGQVFALARPGFVRLDWLGRGPGARLALGYFATPAFPIEVWREVVPVARFSVGLDGSWREEPLSAGRSGAADPRTPTR